MSNAQGEHFGADQSIPNRPGTGPTVNRKPLLNPSDIREFARFGVEEAFLTAAQVDRVSDVEARELYGISFKGDVAGIIYPYIHPLIGDRTTARLRRDNPEIDSEGKLQNKYICAYGDNRHLYFPPGAGELLKDVTVPVVFVEAEKSALAITAMTARRGRRLLSVGTGGCWGWRGKTGIESRPNGEREETRGPLPDFGLFSWPCRKVIIGFDANVATNPKVRRARWALAETLASWSAEVFFLGLPDAEDVNGPDDFIAIAGDEAMLTLLDTAMPVTHLHRGEAMSDWPKPEALGSDLPPVETFSGDLLPESFRKHVEDVSERMQTPVDYAAGATVVTLAGCVNRRALIQPKEKDTGWIVVPNLWGANVGARSSYQRGMATPHTPSNGSGAVRFTYPRAVSAFSEISNLRGCGHTSWKPCRTVRPMTDFSRDFRSWSGPTPLVSGD